nr:uncharacterized protein LOC113813521 [Penaeus vannamei]
MEKESYEIDALKLKDEELDVYKGEEPAGVRRKRELKQVGLVSLVGLSYFSLGAILPWPSPALSDMARNNATLVGTEISLTSAEKDMTGSLVYLGRCSGRGGGRPCECCWAASVPPADRGALCGGLADQRPGLFWFFMHVYRNKGISISLDMYIYRTEIEECKYS